MIEELKISDAQSPYLSTMLPPYLHVVPLRVYFQYVQLGDPLLCQKIVDTDDDKVGR